MTLEQACVRTDIVDGLLQGHGIPLCMKAGMLSGVQIQVGALITARFVVSGGHVVDRFHRCCHGTVTLGARWKRDIFESFGASARIHTSQRGVVLKMD